MTSPRLPTVPFVLLLAACGGGDEADFGPARTLPKEQRPTVWDAPAKDRLELPDMRMQAPAGEPKGELVWVGETPAGWEARPAQPARFRDAVWRVAGNADTEAYVSASQRLGPVGINMNRWYADQFGIQQVPALEALPIVELAGQPARLVELNGEMKGMSGSKAGWAALIAFVSKSDEMVMTFKFTGPEAVVSANKDKFLALAKSLRSATKSPDAKAPPIPPGAQLPPGHAPVNGAQDPHAAPAPPPSAAAPFAATAPAGWTAKQGSPRWLHHGFGSDGEAYVGQLGGGLRPTLDIWRGELGMQPMSDAEFQALPKVAFLGEDSVLLDLAGNFQSMSGKQIQNARVLVAARTDGGSIVFTKLVGPAADVGAQADAFEQFCASVRRAQ